ncbi:NAD(P)H-hydrate dehydratase [Sulfurimonas sp.]|uniref:NAD(P)H-hydrate dehydratase n=1 Tax=Sulfurimonas sp. TaxID=2022749 RepID=UPI003566A715
MQKLYDEVASLDQRCYDSFGLSEDLLMEHAADGMADFIRTKFDKHSSIVIVCGSGNNGADGIALGRLLHKDYDVRLFHVKEPKSEMAILQKKRSDAIGINECRSIEECDVLVDAIVGTGFSGEFNSDILNTVEQMNNSNAYKIACDVPSGYRFFADTTLTMGALKKDMYLDGHKEYVGDIRVLDLGVSREIYESKSDWTLLDLEDLELPNREIEDTHKGSFGHLACISGEKIGAGVLCAKAALRFGAGLVTIVGYNNTNIPHSIMSSELLPDNTTAIAIGMGLGDSYSDRDLNAFLDNDTPLIIDADILHMDILLDILKRKNVVLTPHAKEFVSVLKLCDLADISIEELQKNRFKYVEMFCQKYQNATLLLKGANVIIGQGNSFYVNPHGSSKLAKGGSGDVLSGLIGSLLAQGYEPIEAVKNASLAHVSLALNYTGSDFSLTPDDLISQIGKL